MCATKMGGERNLSNSEHSMVCYDTYEGWLGQGTMNVFQQKTEKARIVNDSYNSLYSRHPLKKAFDS
jgi:hypothetical protein